LEQLSRIDRLLPKASRHNFEDYAARIILSPNEHIAPAVRTCRGSIYRTRNDGRHKCRPYKDLKGKFPYYQVTNLEQPHCVNCIWATACRDLTPDLTFVARIGLGVGSDHRGYKMKNAELFRNGQTKPEVLKESKEG
jgi:hypothetical protein